MQSYIWLPICAGLTGVGLALSWLAWRRRGLTAGLRGAAWALVPIAAYLTGLISLIWDVGVAAAAFIGRFVFSFQVWAGLAVTAIAAVLFVASGVLRRRGLGGPDQGDSAQEKSDGPRQVEATRKQPPADDDLADIEAILRRRGIN